MVVLAPEALVTQIHRQVSRVQELRAKATLEEHLTTPQIMVAAGEVVLAPSGEMQLLQQREMAEMA
jgi:hypothetical protein